MNKVPHPTDWNMIRQGDTQFPSLFDFEKAVKDSAYSDSCIADLEGTSTVQRAQGKLIMDEVARQYANWRNQIHMAASKAGRSRFFRIPVKDRPKLKFLALECLRSGYAPTDHFQRIWNRANIGFIKYDALMAFRYMFYEATIEDTSSQVELYGRHSFWKARQNSSTQKTGQTHSFSDTSQLHAELRPLLTREGFDTSALTDRELMTIQSSAKNLAKASKVFVPGPLRAMAESAKGLFSEDKR